MKIGFVFTNFNNSIFTRKAIVSILSGLGDNSGFIVIVDNSSGDEDIAALYEMQVEFGTVSFIYNHENVGYFEGLNIGLRFLKEHVITELDYVVVGNNDLVFPLNFCGQMEKCAARFLDYPVIAPDIVRIDGVHQNPHVIGNLGVVRKYLLDLYYYNYNLSRIMLWFANRTRRLTGRKDCKSYLIARPISQGYGACYILGPIFFEIYKELWAPSFLMGEEYFLSYQISKKGFKIFYEPEVMVVHYDHATVLKMPSRKLWEYGRTGHLLYRALVDEHEIC